MTTDPKQLTVEVRDDTNANLVERIAVPHLSDLAEGVKDVVEDFVRLNGGTILLPVSIQVMKVDEKAGLCS